MQKKAFAVAVKNKTSVYSKETGRLIRFFDQMKYNRFIEKFKHLYGENMIEQKEN